MSRNLVSLVVHLHISGSFQRLQSLRLAPYTGNPKNESPSPLPLVSRHHFERDVFCSLVLLLQGTGCVRNAVPSPTFSKMKKRSLHRQKEKLNIPAKDTCCLQVEQLINSQHKRRGNQTRKKVLRPLFREEKENMKPSSLFHRRKEVQTLVCRRRFPLQHPPLLLFSTHQLVILSRILSSSAC